MALNIAQARKTLQQFDFQELFINELGWDRFRENLTVKVGADAYMLEAVAQKRGVQIFHCLPDASGKIPDYALRRKIDQKVTVKEHLLIFTDANKTTQIWQWLSKEEGKAAAIHQQPFYAKTSGDALLQKLDRITFSLSDEERLTLTGVTFRLKDAFFKERLTKNFYKVFEQQHRDFVLFIQGIPDEDLQKWYASVMINRLMFLYFIQEKGFLSGDKAYLQNKLKQHQDALLLGAGGASFYKNFLCPLFFEGFAKRDGERSPEMNALLGRVPYLNGGLFAKHQIEEQHGQDLEIPDTAFQKLFAFFDAYDWRLDDRPSAVGTEINPDVLGYIFEKYINQKQMGAYYTKEDITEYISKNTILPFLFDRTRQDCAVAFDGAHSLWHLLQDDPDRYIYPAVKHGFDKELPADIAAGIADVALRGQWNKPAPDTHALPTEIWREVVARRQRCAEIRAKLAAGEVRDINDLITYNLNIRQFAQDCLEQWEGADFLRAFWTQIRAITVLDPTCGSGAFLFAALEILEPLYESCLDRMEAFVADANQLGHLKDFHDFRTILEEVGKHPNRSYFVLKSIIVNNLFGVDIMEEATEICKLRLFLKLAAQIEPDASKPNFGVEPLPDIDFNIRAGNTLVGFATEEQTHRAFTSKLDLDDAWGRITQKAKVVEIEFEKFQKSQTDTAEATSEYARQMKQAILSPLTELRNELDRALALQYGKVGKESMAAWRKSTQPFHWFIEFFGVMKRGGFDAIIGNPPYVSTQKIDYQIPDAYKTQECRDLFAVTTERIYSIARDSAYFGIIIPLSATSTATMIPLKKLIASASGFIWTSYYSASDQPSALFTGVRHRLLILLATVHPTTTAAVLTTRFLKWFSNERPVLFDAFIQYEAVSSFCKISSPIEKAILNKIAKYVPLASNLRPTGEKLYYHNAPVHWGKVFNFIPYYQVSPQAPVRSTHLKDIMLGTAEEVAIVTCALNSSLFYWFNWQYSNCRDLSSKDIGRFPIGLAKMGMANRKSMVHLMETLMLDLNKHSKIYRRVSNNVKTEFDSFYPALSKPIIDQIDRVLAKHYGFTDEETDFIINYDIKYRMGRGGEEEGAP